MSDAALWSGTLEILALLAVALATLFVDGVYEVVTGRPALLPFERFIWKRVPASELDCVRQGAGKLLQATALTFITVPNSFLLLRSAAELTGVIGPAGALLPAAIESPMLITVFAGPIAGLALAVAAYVVSTRMMYVPTGVGGPGRLASNN